MEPNQPEQPSVEPSTEPVEQPTTESPVSAEPVVEEDTEPTTEPVVATTAPVNSTPAVAPAGAVNPGKTMGIVSFVLSLVGIGLVGLILGIIAKSKSKKAGQKNGFALAGIIIGIVNIIVVALITTFAIMGVMAIAQKCNELGSGTHIENGITYTCGTSSNTTQSY
ncbi:hypothetical protein EPN95_02255 [Patescibacteria group bacterium]|nr:MAG: hypothetical protein EPN95_02255 [Patescibacteria group bacterium]